MGGNISYNTLSASILSPCPFMGKGCPKDGKGVDVLLFKPNHSRSG